MIRINLLDRDRPGKQSFSLSNLNLAFAPSADGVGLVVLLIVLMVGIASAWRYQNSQLSSLRQQLQAVQAERERLSQQAERVNRVSDRADLVRQKLQVIADLKTNQTGPVLLLDEVSRLLPDGLWLTLLEAEDGFVNIQGGALSNVSVADLVSNLRSSRYFRDVVLRFSEDTGDAFRFQLNVEFNPAASIRTAGLASAAP